MGAAPPSARLARFSQRAALVAVPETVLRQCHDAGQTVEPVGFEARQSATAPPALQAARREIQGLGQFLERKTGSLHQLFDYGGREAVTDGLAKIVLVVECASQNASAAEFLHHRAQFVYHLSSMIATIVVSCQWSLRHRAAAAQPRAIFARP